MGEGGSRREGVLRMGLRRLVVRTFSSYNYYVILMKSFALKLIIGTDSNLDLFFENGDFKSRLFEKLS